MQQVGELAVTRQQHMGPQEIATVLYGLGSYYFAAGGVHKDVLYELADSLADDVLRRNLLGKFQLRDLAMTTWAFGRLQYYRQDVLHAVCCESRKLLTNGVTPQIAQQLVWGMS